MNPFCPPAVIPESRGAAERVRAAGKFLVRGSEKFFLNGVSYGPFAPNADGEPFPEAQQLVRDLAHIRALGFNGLRLYELPSDIVLQVAEEHGLAIIAGIPWAEHVAFLSSDARREEIEQTIREAARRLGAQAQVAALIVGNEIEKTLVRWMGPREVRDFVERLVAIAKEAAPRTLVSYATYPSTEYLMPRNADFMAVNVYLEEQGTWERYLRRLQNLAGDKPLVISEFGIDVMVRGEAAQAETMRWQRESLLRAGAAGSVWFSYTDEWHRGGGLVEGWHFGLVDHARIARAVCGVAAGLPVRFDPPAGGGPRISVIVCTRNGAATLRECLVALGRQSHANHEVIVIDDGSTDATPEIARSFAFVRYVRQEPSGLSVARNRGAREATGEILAFTDDDCIPDEDWLARLGAAYDDAAWVAAGGPNIPPPPRTEAEAVVALAPGAPTHVLISDEEAEHLPGCNFSVRKEALDAIGGFHEVFTTAGDDVDICWRLRAAGGRLRYVPGAMVWHYRRGSIGSYLRQQRGYGRAEALLMKHHPSRFGPLGGARWRGAIYGDGLGVREPVEGSIYHGPFGFAPFQAVYPQGIAAWWELFAGVLWVAFALLALMLRLPWMAGVLVIAPAWAAWLRAGRNLVGRPGFKLWLLCWLQPVVREWSRLTGMVRLGARPSWRPSLPEIVIPRRPQRFSRRIATVSFWSDTGVGREQWLDAVRQIAAEKKTVIREDDGWRRFDLEMTCGAVATHAFVTVTEYHGGGKRLTRVALLERVSKWVVPVWAAACSIEMIRIVNGVGHRGEFAALVIAALVLCLMRWLARGFSTSLIHEAARRAGLKPVDQEE